MYGWLDPDGEFHECNVLGHSRALKDIDKGLIVVERIDGEIEEATRECQQMEDEQGSCHAEWHIVDMLEGDYLHNLYEAAYDAGFLRVGPCGSELHFEGRRKVFTKQYQTCKDLADELDKRTVFVPRESE
jgi:hypothetical protein